MKYGIFYEGCLMEKFDTPDKAYEAAIYAYNESGGVFPRSENSESI